MTDFLQHLATAIILSLITLIFWIAIPALAEIRAALAWLANAAWGKVLAWREVWPGKIKAAFRE